MASRELNNEFRNTLYTPDFPLDLAIDWINVRMEPEQVFYDEVGYKKLIEWALRNGFVRQTEMDL